MPCAQPSGRTVRCSSSGNGFTRAWGWVRAQCHNQQQYGRWPSSINIHLLDRSSGPAGTSRPSKTQGQHHSHECQHKFKFMKQSSPVQSTFMAATMAVGVVAITCLCTSDAAQALGTTQSSDSGLLDSWSISSALKVHGWES
jgi:hypothetical protein